MIVPDVDGTDTRAPEAALATVVRPFPTPARARVDEQADNSDDEQLDTAGAVQAYLRGDFPRAAAPAVVDQRALVRLNLSAAAGTDGDLEAELQRVSARTGVPMSTARNFPEMVRRRAAAAIDDDTIARFPSTMALLADPNFARLAHDDMGMLQRVESTLSAAAGGAAQATLGIAESVLRTPEAVGRLADYTAGQVEQRLGVPRLLDPLRGVQDLAQFLARGRDPVSGREMGGASSWADRVRTAQRMLATDEQTFGSTFARLGEKGQQADAALMSAFNGDVRPLGSVLSDPEAWAGFLGQAVPSLVAAMKSGGALPFLGWLEAMGTANDAAAFEKKTGQKVDPAQYATALAEVALVNSWLERIGLGKVVGAKGGGVLGVMRATLAEGGTEALQQVNSNAAKLATFDPNQSISEGVLASAMGGAGAGGGTRGALALADAAAGAAAPRMQAQRTAQTLAALQEAAAESKLRRRDPQAFADFVEKAATGTPFETVYIDVNQFGEALAQAGIDPAAVAAAVPAIAQQIDDALAADGDLRIPLQDLAAFAQPEAMKALVPHLRSEPESMSAADAETFDASVQAEMAYDEQQAAADPVAPAQFQASTAAVAENIRARLTKAGRFTDDVHRVYADMTAQFYASLASRMGATPEQVWKAYPLNISFARARMAVVERELGGELGQSEMPADESAPPRRGRRQATGSATAAAPDARSRGAYAPKSRTISLLEGGDLTTFIHEVGHHFLDVLTEVASKGGPRAIKSDVKVLLKWFGVDSLAAWRGMTLDEQRQYHEQFARGFEAFAFEGEAPSIELQGIFARFRAWMLAAYRSLVSLNVTLTPEVRAVMGRMLATDEQVANAQASRAHRPLFADAKAAGMTPSEWQAYQGLGADATRDAEAALQRRSLRNVAWVGNAKARKAGELQKQSDARRDEIRDTVRAEVEAQPVYAARKALSTGAKLSLPALKQLYGEGPAAPWRYLSTGPAGLAATEGADPDAVADLFGFDSGDALVRALLAAQPIDQVVDGITDQRMLEQHGDLADRQSIERAAEAAIYNDARARFLAAEHEALARATGQKPTLLRAAKDYAAGVIARTKVRELHPNQYTVAEARSARNAERAFRAGDTAKAADAKRAQLLNGQLAIAAGNAVDEVDRGVQYLKKYGRSGTRENLRGEALAQIDELLARFDLRTSLSLAEIDRRKPLGEWVAAEAERLSAVVPDIPAQFLDESYRQHYRNMTVEEFRGLVDTVRQLDLLARREQKQYMEVRGMQFDAERSAILAALRVRNPDAFDVDGDPVGLTPDFVPSIGKGLRELGDKFAGEFLSPETILSVLDGGQVGQLHDSLFGRMSTRADWKASRLAGIRKTLQPLLKQYSPIEKAAFARRGHLVESIGQSVTRENAVAVALHYGNADGRERLRNYGWGDAQVRDIVALLDAKDWRLVDGIWRLFDEDLWPDLQALNERTRGVAPPKVQPTPYATPHGQARGGYFRLKYDTELDERAHRLDEGAAVKELLGGSLGMSAKTGQGTSTARLDKASMRPRLDLGVMAEAINETVHDLAYREAVADTIRLLNDKGVQAAIKSTAGVQAYRALVTRVREVAAPPRNPVGFIERTLSMARRNTVVTLMSGVKTALQNFTGLLPALAKVHPGLLAREVARFYTPQMAERYAFVVEQSEFMRNRFNNFDRDLQEGIKKMTVQGSLMPDTATFLALLGWVDRGVATPVWLAAFAEGMQRFTNDRERAVTHADQIVRQTQGSGREVDLPAIMGGHGGYGQLKRVFTMFQSYFNAQLNLLVQTGAIARQEAETAPALAVAKFTARFVVIVVLPAMLTELAFGGGGGQGEGDDKTLKRYLRALAMYGAAMFPIVRDLASFAWAKFDPDTPQFGYKMTPAQAWGEGIVKGAASFADIASGRGDRRDLRDVIMGTSFAVGLPGKLISDTVLGTAAWLDGTAGPQAVVLGAPKGR